MKKELTLIPPPAVKKEETPKVKGLDISQFLDKIKACDQCLWQPVFNPNIKPDDEIKCELGQPAGKFCNGYLSWQTCMALCEDCCKKLSLSRIQGSKLEVKRC